MNQQVQVSELPHRFFHPHEKHGLHLTVAMLRDQIGYKPGDHVVMFFNEKQIIIERFNLLEYKNSTSSPFKDDESASRNTPVAVISSDIDAMTE